MLTCKDLNELELDGLKESMNICMGKAAFALSEIFGKQVRISIPPVGFEPTQQLGLQLETSERMVGVSIAIVGDAKGDLILFFNKPDALTLANLLQNDYSNLESSCALDEQKKSVLTEVGNIVLSSFLATLADFTTATLLHEVPKFHATFKEVLDKSRSARFLQTDESNCFLLKSEFEVDSAVASGYLFLLPEISLLSVLVKTIRKMLE